MIKSKLKELDEKQMNEISDIETFFGIKGLEAENVETKAKLSITFINNELFICKLFVNNSEFKYGEKTEKICIEFVDMLRLKINYDFLSDGEVTST